MKLLAQQIIRSNISWKWIQRKENWREAESVFIAGCSSGWPGSSIYSSNISRSIIRVLYYSNLKVNIWILVKQVV